MENTGRLLFENDSPQWYVALGERWVGPMTAADLYEKVQDRHFSWAHYAWKKGQPGWKRICDILEFQQLVPDQPAAKPSIKPSSTRQSSAQSAPVSDVKNWYLHYNDSQFGPFSQSEIVRFINIGKINGRVHAWSQGMKNWDRLERINEFQSQLKPKQEGAPPSFESNREQTRMVSREESKSKSKKTENEDQRQSPRRPLVAKVIMSDEQSVIVGICRDISIGGLQVLTDQIPATVGSKLKMNISPSSNEMGKKIESFVAEGIIVRILEDRRGFSFRFSKLTESAKQAIEAYIDSSN